MAMRMVMRMRMHMPVHMLMRMPMRMRMTWRPRPSAAVTAELGDRDFGRPAGKARDTGDKQGTSR